MTHRRSFLRRGVAASVATAMIASLGVLSSAQADTSPAPAGPANPETATATPLPTVQIDGVAWAQAVVGNTVYVGGLFTSARPPGEPANTPNKTPRSNLLAYDIRTGELINSWAPEVNAQVLSVEAAPDGSRIYVGGDFTTVNGVTHRRLVALDPVTGAIIPKFNPSPNSRVRAIVPTQDTVYYAGSFTAVNTVPRDKAAATRVADGTLTNWAPVSAGGVWAMNISPTGDRILLGGQFQTMNGSGNPGRGLAAVDTVTGKTNLPWAANTALIRNGGNNGAITDLQSDGNSVYAAGFTFGRDGGTLEGVAKMSWNGGAVEWVQDCHGDSYGINVQPDVVYVVSHAHYCGNLPTGFPQGDPTVGTRAMAFSKAATGTLRTEYFGYSNFAGTPAPTELHWYPYLQQGSFTGQTQAAWTIEGNSDFLAVGGEFARAGNLYNQYGLVRYAKKNVAGGANTTAGELSGLNMNPIVTPTGPGEVLVSWRANWDRDNTRLRYEIIRNNVTASPVYETTVDSKPWSLPSLSFLDTGLTPGSTVSYRVFATDPDGNQVRSGTVSVTVSGAGKATDGYARTVLADGPMDYWRMNEASGSNVADLTGLDKATTTSGVTRNVPGVIAGDSATRFNGTTSQYAYSSTLKEGLLTDFSLEAWFQSSSNSGGRILGFGNRQTGSSTTRDRTLYLDNQGRVNFGTWQGSNRVLTSSGGLNNGKWHHVVGTVSQDKMTLYVDGVKVGERTDTYVGRWYSGYWRIGGDTLSGWPNDPSSDYLNGAIDEVAVYSSALPADRVQRHFQAATTANVAPTASFTSSVSDLTATFTSTATDTDGTIVSHLWEFGDGTTSTETNPTKVYATAGTFPVTLTVTDDQGASGSKSGQVTTALPAILVSDSFQRTVSNGWGAAPVGGNWSAVGGAANFAVNNGTGALTMPNPGAGPRANLGPVAAANTDSTVTFSLDKLANGGGTIVSLLSRANGSDGYRAKVKVAADGRLSVSLSATVSGAETTLGSTLTLPVAQNYVVGDRLVVRLQTVGTSPTTLRMKVWKAGTAEPSAWQVERTDSAAALQTNRGVALGVFLSGAATNQPVVARFDDLFVGRLD